MRRRAHQRHDGDGVLMNILNNLQKISHQCIIHRLPDKLFVTEPVGGGAIQVWKLVRITIAQLCFEKIME